MKELQLIINSSEITAGTRGSSLGPDAVITAARKKENYFFRDHPIMRIENENQMLDTEVKYPFAKRIEGLVKVYERISTSVKLTLDNGKFPYVLASDHGSAGGTIAGIKAAYPNKRLGVIWIDAHGDLHTPYTTPSGNMHGMPLATALGEDNLECRSNNPHVDIVDHWNSLKNTGLQGSKLNPEDLVFIGVRDTEPQEDAILERLSITNHRVESVRSEGAQAIINKCLDQLSDCDMIYVSFDVDSMDPDLTSYGTGTPVANGITPDEARDFLCAFGEEEKLVCMEFVEVNPCLDNKQNRMAEITFDLFEAAANSIKK
ncbi:MAG: arginase [Crocinitomicaceae bacterium]|nr:arginase [Crocinitomicaceae bacterium]